MSKSSNIEIQNAEILGFSHVLEQYLNRGTYIVQDHKKTTSLWIKNNASVKDCSTQI